MEVLNTALYHTKVLLGFSSKHEKVDIPVIYMFNRQCTDKFFAIDINDSFDFCTALALWPVIIICVLFRLLAKIIGLFGKAAIIIFTTIEYLIKALLGGNDGTNN